MSLVQSASVEPVEPAGAEVLRWCTPTAHACRMADPLFILAPPRSFSSVVCAMLGQHPQMYGMPELQLFGAETIEEWWGGVAQATYPMAHGLTRAVAQIFFGEQSESTVAQASGWIRRRSQLSTGMMLELLAEAVFPLIPVDKSPSVVYRLDAMRRMIEMFPQARFIHLLRHPRGHGGSVMKLLRTAAQAGAVPYWILHLASFPEVNPGSQGDALQSGTLDPQHGWYRLHGNICEALSHVPAGRWLRLRGEELLTEPDRVLRSLAEWLELRADDDAVTAMKHPERSPFACFGPNGARLGNDANFLRNPFLRPEQVESLSLQGPLAWREDGGELTPLVQEMAREFGYE